MDEEKLAVANRLMQKAINEASIEEIAAKMIEEQNVSLTFALAIARAIKKYPDSIKLVSKD